MESIDQFSMFSQKCANDNSNNRRFDEIDNSKDVCRFSSAFTRERFFHEKEELHLIEENSAWKKRHICKFVNVDHFTSNVYHICSKIINRDDQEYYFSCQFDNGGNFLLFFC